MTSSDVSSASQPQKGLNPKITSLPTTIFEVMTKLSIAHNSVNLGQGFPDDEGPESMKKIAGDALVDFHNQYPPLMGIPELRQAVARHSEKFQGIPVDWATETLVTVGATEAIASVFLGLLSAGDEVIMFDPMYDSYTTMASLANATVRPVRLRLPDFSVPLDELEAAFTPRTKFILINTPHNPSGKLFTRAELETIAHLCQKHDVLAVCDEVYEHLVFGGGEHVSLRSLPGMMDRTLRMGSAGKTFSFTSWKVGWVTGPARLIAAAAKAHQFIVFTVPSSLQRAVAYGLDNEHQFYTTLGESLSRKKELLESGLKKLGVPTLPGNGAYFLIADVSRFLKPGETDVDFCQRLTVEGGVTLIPTSGFYVGPNPPRHLVRFCYCKDDSKIKAALERLEKYLPTQ
nr:pyridoxal phosphate-dependent aspartate aminotransferase (PLPAT) [Polytomella parva]|eukprot:CAMPEP_0175050530 /NCGR_PEP_ID=MMETSP0052_2-20121109/7309_1 /TAXON_ID=51329 ORGANISM="Polytomella parva, Strain SAG 63-3" /NCGR_SAMPLE_ID=MMETSP0052_2 /ASSEMBLY_ACC=CAM_ASM_000194 /LENGTH=401 /DNA_ID=CAMNT_0016314741 /DNA_START=1330 /DNA_END=2535 /DNA_ORIENTATION=-